MTKSQIDRKRFDLHCFISDKFKDIQMQAAALKNPEDQTKDNQLMTKIADDIADVRRAFGDITELDAQIPDEEHEEFSGYPFARIISK